MVHLGTSLFQQFGIRTSIRRQPEIHGATTTLNTGGGKNQFLAKLPVLDRKNCDWWIIQMKVIFRYHDGLDVINDGVTAVDGEALCEKGQRQHGDFPNPSIC